MRSFYFVSSADVSLCYGQFFACVRFVCVASLCACAYFACVCMHFVFVFVSVLCCVFLYVILDLLYLYKHAYKDSQYKINATCK